MPTCAQQEMLDLLVPTNYTQYIPFSCVGTFTSLREPLFFWPCHYSLGTLDSLREPLFVWPCHYSFGTLDIIDHYSFGRAIILLAPGEVEPEKSDYSFDLQ